MTAKAPRRPPEPLGSFAPGLEALLVPVDALEALEGNPRRGDIAAVARSYAEFGQRKPIVARHLPDGRAEVTAGNTQLAAALELGWTHIATVWADDDDVRAKAWALADNRTSELGLYDEAALVAYLEAVGAVGDADLFASTGYTEADLAALVGHQPAHTAPNAVPPLPAVPETKRGDVWVLGRHRLGCGDATDAADVARTLDGVSPDVLLTDPPYCSGGFQEAGRAMGSVGTVRHINGKRVNPKVANDTLSTRGYQALIRAVLGLTTAPMAYVFTDWRMWVNLFDVMESSGFGVRQMIVWDKGTPGMGTGWRSQHELVMFGSRAAVAFDPHKAVGNVIGASRSGNDLHPTQKPVEVLERILELTDMAATVYDPMVGSGSTIIAAERAGRAAYGLELDPAYVDVTVRRWAEYTGREPSRAVGSAT